MPVSEMKTFKIIQSRKETKTHTHIHDSKTIDFYDTAIV